jgi:DNA (cytosine-5)-methyltransferase 1
MSRVATTLTGDPKYLYSIDEKELRRRQRRVPTLISLFSGCGGCALGMRQDGFEVRVFVERDKAACETLALNWIKPRGKKGRRPWHQARDPVIMSDDITQLSTARILEAASLAVGEADALEGGFPCQGFSIAGKQMIADPRNQLYKECVRVIREALPRTFVLENVPGLVSMASGAIMRQICHDLSFAGYDLHWDILDAADFGVPQRRKRVIFIGRRIDALVTNGRRIALVMGAAAGRVSHPTWFERKFPERHRLCRVKVRARKSRKRRRAA